MTTDEDRDAGLRALNLAYGLGVQCGLTGERHTKPDRQGLSRAALDQLLAGWAEGRRLHFLPPPAFDPPPDLQPE